MNEAVVLTLQIVRLTWLGISVWRVLCTWIILWMETHSGPSFIDWVVFRCKLSDCIPLAKDLSILDVHCFVMSSNCWNLFLYMYCFKYIALMYIVWKECHCLVLCLIMSRSFSFSLHENVVGVLREDELCIVLYSNIFALENLKKCYFLYAFYIMLLLS